MLPFLTSTLFFSKYIFIFFSISSHFQGNKKRPKPYSAAWEGVVDVDVNRNQRRNRTTESRWTHLSCDRFFVFNFFGLDIEHIRHALTTSTSTRELHQDSPDPSWDHRGSFFLSWLQHSEGSSSSFLSSPSSSNTYKILEKSSCARVEQEHTCWDGFFMGPQTFQTVQTKKRSQTNKKQTKNTPVFFFGFVSWPNKESGVCHISKELRH